MARGQECTDPTNPAVSRLYNRECTADTVTIRTAQPLTLRSGDTYGRNIVVHGKEVTLAANLTNDGREVTVIPEKIRCGNKIFCGKNGRSATYVAPRGGNIKLTGASLLCNTLNLIADGGKGAAGQDGQRGSPCEPAIAAEDGCTTKKKCTSPKIKKTRQTYYQGADAAPGKAGGNGGAGGSGTLPGSGGNIEARFVNQTAVVLPRSSIGAFPKRASGGAAGGASSNCQGASGGKGARLVGFFVGFGECMNNIAPFCNGGAQPPVSSGNAGLSGPDPQTLPGAANLTKGTITLEQLEGVDSLLPYYDQVQLDMILGEGNARYIAKDYSGAGDIYSFLTTLTGPCLTGKAGPSNRNTTFAQGQICSMRRCSKVSLFMEEIISKLRLDAFLSGLQAIASIATGSLPNLLQIGDIYKKVSESKAPALFKDNTEVAGGGVVACSVLSGVLKDGLSGLSCSICQGGVSFRDSKLISSLRGQINNLQLTASQAYGRLQWSVNPADALYSNFFEGAYSGLVNNIRAYLYQAYHALTYTSLAVSSPADDNKISDYAGLTAAFAAYQDAAVQALAKAGGEKQQFKPSRDTTFVVTQDNALN
ncbi:g9940 [Coccomyxa elongata]